MEKERLTQRLNPQPPITHEVGRVAKQIEHGDRQDYTKQFCTGRRRPWQSGGQCGRHGKCAQPNQCRRVEISPGVSTPQSALSPRSSGCRQQEKLDCGRAQPNRPRTHRLALSPAQMSQYLIDIGFGVGGVDLEANSFVSVGHYRECKPDR